MKTTDKFLIGIVAGIVLLVGVAFAVALTRPRPTYQPEDTPEGVAHNFLLALQKEEYERAYGYLSPTLPGYPASAERFADDVEEHHRDVGLDTRVSSRDTTLSVESARVTGDRARVSVQETRFRNGGLFDSGQYTHTFDVTLRRENGAWKISHSDSYWVWCWDDKDGCS